MKFYIGLNLYMSSNRCSDRF